MTKHEKWQKLDIAPCYFDVTPSRLLINIHELATLLLETYVYTGDKIYCTFDFVADPIRSILSSRQNRSCRCRRSISLLLCTRPRITVQLLK